MALIDKPGLYRTRKGVEVRIDEISGTSSWPCKGMLQRRDRLGRRITRGCWGTWGRDGRRNALPGSNLDIVAYIGA